MAVRATRDQLLALLNAELNTPTFGFTYVNGTTQDDVDSAASLNTKDQVLGKRFYTPIQFMEAVDPADWNVMGEGWPDPKPTQNHRATYWVALLAAIKPGEFVDVQSPNIQKALIEDFPAGSNTRTDLLESSDLVTRWDSLLINAGYELERDLKGNDIRQGWEYVP